MRAIIRHLQLLTILPLGLLLFWPTFQLALSGDDWLAIWNYQSVRALESESLLEHFFTLYGPQEIWMWSMSRAFGYEGTIYYILSFVLRMFASFSLYPLVVYFTKNKLAGFLSVLAFALTFTGLEATNWVFNMNVYLAIALMNLSLYFLLLSKRSTNIIDTPVSLLLFFLAHILAPSRITLFVFVVFMVDLIETLPKINMKAFIKRQFPFLIVFVLSKLAGNYSIGYHLGSIRENIVSGEYSIQFIKQFFITLGSLIIPQTFLTNRQLGVLGIVFLMFTSSLIYKFRSQKVSRLMVVSLLFLITGVAAPFILWPNLQYVSSHRHLLLAAPAIALLWGSFFSLSNTRVVKGLILAIFLVIAGVQVYSIDKYFSHLANTRSETIEDAVWGQLLHLIPSPQSSPYPYVFYFESDSQSADTLSDLVFFGFQVKVGVLYSINSSESLPTPVVNFGDLERIMKHGRTLPSGSYQYIPVDNVFAYRLEEKINIRDITQETRVSLLSNK